MLSSINSSKNKPLSVICAGVNRSMEYKVEDEISTSAGNKIKASAIFQKLYTKNANGHHMNEACLIKEIGNAQEDIRERHFLGELDHPEDLDDLPRIMTVQLGNASHVITRMEVDGNYVVGDFETMTTPKGMILRSLLADNIKVGVSIRAVTDQDLTYDGSTYQDVNDFNLVCYDAVHNPAFSDAYVTGLLSSVYRINPVDTGNLFHKNEPTGELITLNKSELKELVSAMVSTVVKQCFHKKRLY